MSGLTKFDRDFAYKYLAPKYFINTTRQKTYATITFWYTKMNRLSTLRLTLFLETVFDRYLPKRKVVRLRMSRNANKTKYRRIFIFEIQDNPLFLSFLYDLPYPRIRGVARGHHLIFRLHAFVITIPISDGNISYGHKILHYLPDPEKDKVKL